MWLILQGSSITHTLPASTSDEEVLNTLQKHDRAELWLPNTDAPTKTLRPPFRPTKVYPACTCHVRMAMGIDLPDCPRGLAQGGRRYATWDDVPNDSLLPDRYEARNGHPPPKCPTCGNWAYESEPECRYCTSRERWNASTLTTA